MEPSVLLKPKSNLFKILFILIPLLVIAGLIGFIFIKHPFNLFQPKNTSTIPSVGPRNYPKYNMIGFYGKVKEKGRDYLVLTGGGKTIKVEVNNQVKIQLINQAEFAKNPKLYLAKPPEFITFSEIKIGDNVDTFGTGNKNLINTKFIAVIK